MNDRHFSNDAARFAKNIYGTSKGIIRERVLKNDLDFLISSQSKHVLDVGAGIGQVNALFALKGHRVTHVEPSQDMLIQAKRLHELKGASSQYEYIESSIQNFAGKAEGYDIVCCHAVLEWLEDPWWAWRKLTSLVAPNGWLSLMFYNVEAKRMANLVYGNFDYVQSNLKVKKKVRFSPQNPLKISEVQNWVESSNLQIVKHSGVRVIHDYLKERERIDDNQLMDLELHYRSREPYRSLGRYQHLLLRKV